MRLYILLSFFILLASLAWAGFPASDADNIKVFSILTGQPTDVHTPFDVIFEGTVGESSHGLHIGTPCQVQIKYFPDKERPKRMISFSAIAEKFSGGQTKSTSGGTGLAFLEPTVIDDYRIGTSGRTVLARRFSIVDNLTGIYDLATGKVLSLETGILSPYLVCVFH